MASPTVIISLDPEECLLTQPLHHRPWFGVDQLLLKRREERLSDRIVVARASTAHRALDIVRDTEISKHPGRVLGGSNRWSQHLECGGVDGQASGMDAGVNGQICDEVAGEALAAAGS